MSFSFCDEHSSSAIFFVLPDQTDDGGCHKTDRREEETTHIYFSHFCISNETLNIYTLIIYHHFQVVHVLCVRCSMIRGGPLEQDQRSFHCLMKEVYIRQHTVAKLDQPPKALTTAATDQSKDATGRNFMAVPKCELNYNVNV